MSQAFYFAAVLFASGPLIFQTTERRPIRSTLYQWPTLNAFVFAALHAMQTRSSDENSIRPSVCPSVRLSNAWIVTKRKKELSRFFIPHKRAFSLVFWKEEWLVGATPSTWNFGSTDPRWSEIADFEPIFARSASAITSSEKKFN